MRRSSLATLSDMAWVPVENDPLLCGVVPSASHVLVGMLAGGEAGRREVCKKVFVDFKNYFEDDGETAVPNTIEARMELFNWRPARDAIVDAITKAHEAIAEGEDDAASD